LEIKLKEIHKEAEERIKQVTNKEELKKVQVEFLGRKKGKITQLLRNMAALPSQERPLIGKLINEIKGEIQKSLEVKRKQISKEKTEEYIDITFPGKKPKIGKIHPLTHTMEEIKRVFISMGFQVVRGPEMETEYYNFEALNMPSYHPARNEYDSFYLDNGYLLRSHTSPVQIRVMEKEFPPIRIIVPGRVYRRDAIDASHFPMFHQVEGLAVDERITFSDLKGVLTCFAHQMFGKNTLLRFRPSFFPFTEPSADLDIQCVICKGKGCKTCGRKGWLEILGAGMVDPEVFKKVGYNSEKYQGFAFGMGVERICMLKYGIDDIRLFFQNDLRFLKQF